MTRTVRWSKRLTTRQYYEGLNAIAPRMNDLQRRILVAQYNAPRRTAYATQLARLANIPGGYPTVNAQYGRLGHMFCDATQYEADVRTNGTRRWWAVWSLGHSTRKGFIWEMLPEVARALEQLGWVRPVTPPSQALREQSPFPNEFEEGRIKYQLHRRKERNREVVRRKKESVLSRTGSLPCEVCGFDFASAYGPLGKGFAECHHLVPLASLEESRRTCLSELAIVCANCHRMLHRNCPMISLEQLRRVVQIQRDTTGKSGAKSDDVGS